MGITALFLLQLLLTFLVGSLWIHLTALAGTRFGSQVGGFIAGLPSTVLLSFFFIGLTQSPESAARATTVFPLAIGISGIFLVVFAGLVRRGFLLALSAALGAWLALSALVLLCRPSSFPLNLGVYAMTLAGAYAVLERGLAVAPMAGPNAAPSGGAAALRCLGGGAVIMATVLAAKLGGPVVGGLCAAFPAMFIATLAVSHAAHGAEFSRAMTKPLLVTGMVTVAVYAVSVRYCYPAAGLVLGTAASIVLAAAGAYVTFRYILPKAL